MGAGGVALAGLRTLVLLVALAVIGLGAWMQHTVRDIEDRGGAILQATALSSDGKEQWQALFNDALESQIRMWIALGIGCFAFLAGLVILLSGKLDWMKVSCYVLVPLELLSMLAMAGAFTITLLLAVKLDPACKRLDPSSPGDVMAFGVLCPLSKSWSVAGGLGLFILAITSFTALINICRRGGKQTCSFEPTASALGMGHGYQAVAPPVARSNIPTMYDPGKSINGSPSLSTREDEEMGFANAGAAMGTGDPTALNKAIGVETTISAPLDFEKSETVQQIRPARPWSEAPRKKN